MHAPVEMANVVMLQRELQNQFSLSPCCELLQGALDDDIECVCARVEAPQPSNSSLYLLYVTGYGKTDHFAHNFKIELLVFKGSVDLKQ